MASVPKELVPDKGENTMSARVEGLVFELERDSKLGNPRFHAENLRGAPDSVS